MTSGFLEKLCVPGGGGGGGGGSGTTSSSSWTKRYGYDEHDNGDNICSVEEEVYEEEQGARISC